MSSFTYRSLTLRTVTSAAAGQNASPATQATPVAQATQAVGYVSPVVDRRPAVSLTTFGQAGPGDSYAPATRASIAALLVPGLAAGTRLATVGALPLAVGGFLPSASVPVSAGSSEPTGSGRSEGDAPPAEPVAGAAPPAGPVAPAAPPGPPPAAAPAGAPRAIQEAETAVQRAQARVDALRDEVGKLERQEQIEKHLNGGVGADTQRELVRKQQELRDAARDLDRKRGELRTLRNMDRNADAYLDHARALREALERRVKEILRAMRMF